MASKFFHELEQGDRLLVQEFSPGRLVKGSVGVLYTQKTTNALGAVVGLIGLADGSEVEVGDLDVPIEMVES